MDKRALVIAPHNDDEVLGAGGMIQRHLAEGYKVKVIIMTNGDGQLRPPGGNRIKLGYRRQKETLAALKLLGLSEDDVFFLGYPDKGLAKLWTHFWEYGKLYISKYTATDYSPYKNSYTLKAPYCGLAVVRDLKEIIRCQRPSILYFPHPNDQHPDHWATNALLLYALEELKEEERTAGKSSDPRLYLDKTRFRCPATSFPAGSKLLTYLVHREKWPLPRGYFKAKPLDPPAKLLALDTVWLKYELTLEETQKKYEAILQYRSQTDFIKKYLISFARRNELFGQVPTLKLKVDCPEPERLIVVNKKRGNLREVSLAGGGDYLLIQVGCKRRINSQNIVLHIKHIGQSKSHKSKVTSQEIKDFSTLDLRLVTVIGSWQIPLKSLGHPQKIILGVELQRNGAILENSAYRLIELS